MGAITLAAPAAASEPLFTGTLTDKAGNPISGPMFVTAMPDNMRKYRATFTVGTAEADANGHYEVTVTDAARIKQLAAEQEGVVDFAIASQLPGVEGSGFVSRRVVRDGDDLRLVDSSLDAAAARRASAGPPVVDFQANDRRVATRMGGALTLAEPLASRQQVAMCMKTGIESVKSISKWTIIGELNNAYNDGTVATFTYGRSHHAETTIGVAQATADGGWEISATKEMTNSGEIGFPPAKRRWARKLQTGFEYTKTTEKIWCGFSGYERTTIRPTNWDGGARDVIKQAKALDRCDRAVKSYPPNARARTAKQSAIRWNGAVNAFGASLTAQSGFSDNVIIEYHFGGRGNKQHRVCGEDGKQPIWEAGRIYSGTRH
ncbi:MAG: hypothetical protein QM679_02340 [Patulibacter sp.]